MLKRRHRLAKTCITTVDKAKPGVQRDGPSPRRHPGSSAAPSEEVGRSKDTSNSRSTPSGTLLSSLNHVALVR